MSSRLVERLAVYLVADPDQTTRDLVEVVVDAYQAHMLDEHERMAAKERAFFEQRLAAQPKP